MKVRFGKGVMMLAVMAVIALVAITLVAASPAMGVARVSDEEGARICGGQSGCANYSSMIVTCGTAQCQGMTQNCPTQNKLVTGNTLTAKNVTQYPNASCLICGNYCGRNLQTTGWDPCVTATTQ